jgi:hypothetical protein
MTEGIVVVVEDVLCPGHPSAFTSGEMSRVCFTSDTAIDLPRLRLEGVDGGQGRP